MDLLQAKRCALSKAVTGMVGVLDSQISLASAPNTMGQKGWSEHVAFDFHVQLFDAFFKDYTPRLSIDSMEASFRSSSPGTYGDELGVPR